MNKPSLHHQHNLLSADTKTNKDADSLLARYIHISDHPVRLLSPHGKDSYPQRHQ